jgi:hypothetical protein
VSKRKDSAYRSGRSPDWLKMNNPACAAVTREAGGGLGKMIRMIRRRSEIVRLTNERDFSHLVELALPPDSTANDASQSAAARVDTRSSKSIFDSASQTPPLRMHSAIALGANA